MLIVLYELGQGIWPAAYLSIGACAGYAHVLGIGGSENVGAQMKKVLTFVELEERRRVWWAIVILDRFVVPDVMTPSFGTGHRQSSKN